MMMDGVVAFAFGSPASIFSNRLIARISANWAEKLGNAWIFTQKDIQFEESLHASACYINEENPPTTLRMAREAVRWAVKHHIVRLWVVAAKPHLSRCVRDLKEAVREAEALIIICIPEDIRNSVESIWFCPDSTLSRAQSKKSWERRERIIWRMPFAVYRLIAS